MVCATLAAAVFVATSFSAAAAASDSEVVGRPPVAGGGADGGADGAGEPTGAAGVAAEGGAEGAVEDAAEGAVCQIYPATGTEFLFHTYQGGSTDVFADANLGTPFDIFVDTYDTYLDANDTSGAFVILTGYDNTAKTAKGRILNSVIYVG